ncbi:MAG TPA: TetR/AcrR family transcriptional regulator [Candidatus Limnocylindria bacterium]|nr:TetR/AcrR family transcriptional regulator [Candidatus Limnocylindria bacterium]
MGYQKGLESREAILDAAAAVVRRRGFEATSFADVCDAIGISRGKLTHHFPTKEALFEAVLESRFQRFRQRIVAPLLDTAREPRARIVASLDELRAIYGEGSTVPGCYIGHTAMDLATRTPAMQQQLDRLLDDWRAAFADALIALGRPHPTARGQAFLAVSAIQGAVLLARAQPEKHALIETLDELQRTLLADT